MRISITILATLVLAGLAGSLPAEEPKLTIYNQDFAVIKETIPLELAAGVNTVRFSGTTAHLEPHSVSLRDPAGKHKFTIIEQNYRADPISQAISDRRDNFV